MAKNSDFDTAVQEEIDAGETVVVSADNPVGIARSNVMYITLNEIGELDAKGKRLFAAGYKGKWIAKANKPVSTLIVPVLATLLEHAALGSAENAERELECLKKYVAKLSITKPAPVSAAS